MASDETAIDSEDEAASFHPSQSYCSFCSVDKKRCISIEALPTQAANVFPPHIPRSFEMCYTCLGAFLIALTVP